MPKSFIKIKPVTAHSERHNERGINPKYLIEPSNENYNVENEKIVDRLEKIRDAYQKSVGQKMQKKATPIREAVVLLSDDDNDKNIANLYELTDKLKELYGIKTFQWHIHNDEGHIDENGKPQYNYHAHLVFDWTDDKGKSLKLNKLDMSDIQTMTAEILQMERGKKGSKSLSLNHQEFRGFMQIKEELREELKRDLTKKEEKGIRQKIVTKRKQGDENKRAKRTGVKR